MSKQGTDSASSVERDEREASEIASTSGVAMELALVKLGRPPAGFNDGVLGDGHSLALPAAVAAESGSRFVSISRIAFVRLLCCDSFNFEGPGRAGSTCK